MCKFLMTLNHVIQNLKMIITLTKYSKYQKPRCNCCGYAELDGLTIDHIEGRRNIKQDENKHGDKLYRLLRHNGYPKGFSTLCFNCNSAKAESGKCPHEK